MCILDYTILLAFVSLRHNFSLKGRILHNTVLDKKVKVIKRGKVIKRLFVYLFVSFFIFLKYSF